jgi:hypothetical protein
MFERYDEAARRTLFFARYQVTRLVSQIDGVIRMVCDLVAEPAGTDRYERAQVIVASLESLKGQIEEE